MKHYSNKSNARRAALSQGVNLDNTTFVQAAEGWYWEPIELDQAMATAIAEVDTSAEDAALAQLEPGVYGATITDLQVVNGKPVYKIKVVTPVEAKPMPSHYAPVTALSPTRCPHCGTEGTDNGLIHHGDEVNGKIIRLQKEFECMACGEEFGEPVATPAKQKASQNKGNGLKIEKDRAEQNGVTRPSKGGVCAQLWEMFDAMYAEKGIVPTPNPAKARSGEMGISPVTTTVQLYQWRAFMGFKGR